MIRELDGVRPEIHPTAYVHPAAEVIGRVRLGPRVSIWPCVVLRGDVEEIVVGEGTNIQDNTSVHSDHGIPTIIGSWISVGHGAILHGCHISDNCLIGMGAILLNKSFVEEEALVGAGALVSPGMKVAARTLVMGVPARVIRPLNPADLEHIRQNARHYLDIAQQHAKTTPGIR